MDQFPQVIAMVVWKSGIWEDNSMFDSHRTRSCDESIFSGFSLRVLLFRFPEQMECRRHVAFRGRPTL